MNLQATIKSNETFKQLALWSLMPSGQSRPRKWVKLFLLPFTVTKGKRATVRKKIRFDVFPYHRFILGDRSTIEDFCTVNNAVGDIRIGNHTRIGIGSVLIGPVEIGSQVRLAQNVVVTSLNHNYTDVTVPISEQGVQVEKVSIGDETWIGANSTILPGINIGKHCVIGAGSVVTRDIPSFCVAVGNPAKIVKRYNPGTGEWEKV